MSRKALPVAARLPSLGNALFTRALACPPGYRIEAVVTGLTFPTGVTFDQASDVRFKLSGGLLFHEDRTFGTPLSVATRTIGTISAGLQGETARGDHWETTAFAQWQTFRNFTSQITPSPLLRAGELRDRIPIILE